MKPILSAAVLFLCSAATLLPQDTGSARDLLPAPELKAKPGPSELDLQGDSHTLYEQVAHAFGLECVFDKDFPAGPGIHFHVMGDDYREALHALEAATGSFVVAVTDHVFLVARDTPQNRAEHEPTVKMVVHLSQAENAQQMTEVVRAVQQAIGVEKASWNAQSGTVEFIGPLSKVIPARQIFEDLRRPRPQVLVELQMIEVSRNDMLSWGLTPAEHDPD